MRQISKHDVNKANRNVPQRKRKVIDNQVHERRFSKSKEHNIEA